MSIYIKGLEFPKDGTFHIVYIYGDGHIKMPFLGKGLQIVPGMEAISVPDHGRLVDVDALKAWFVEWYDPIVDLEIYRFLEILGDESVVPTIIPAEKEVSL